MLGLIRKKMSPIICHGANAESRHTGFKGRQHLYDTLSVIILTMYVHYAVKLVKKCVTFWASSIS